jgi:hypothetical protein
MGPMGMPMGMPVEMGMGVPPLMPPPGIGMGMGMGMMGSGYNSLPGRFGRDMLGRAFAGPGGPGSRRVDISFISLQPPTTHPAKIFHYPHFYSYPCAKQRRATDVSASRSAHQTQVVYHPCLPACHSWLDQVKRVSTNMAA